MPSRLFLHMLKPGDTLQLQVERFALEGRCVSRHDGLVVFVTGAVPGDTARVRIEKVKRNYAEGVLTDVLTPSPLRTTPPCPYFGICGGCRWQHVQYHAQLELKHQNVIDAFERIGGFSKVDVAPIIPADEIYYYRNKIEFSFSKERWASDTTPTAIGTERKAFALGFHHAGRYDRVLDVDACLLQSERSNQVLQATKELCQEMNLEVYDPETESGYLRYLVIREGKRTGDWMINLVTYEDRPEVASSLCSRLRDRFPDLTTFVNTVNPRRAQIATGDLERVYHGSGTITEILGKYTFRISANSFFQTNTEQAEKLFQRVKELAEFRSSDIVYDLYSGTGTLSIFISDVVQKVIGIELIPSAVRDAEHNAQLNNVLNCVFLQGDLKEKLTRDTQWIDEHGRPNVVILDPPRSGMHPKAAHRIVRLRPPRIVYVSCNPATQARDIRFLVGAGYRLDYLQPIDLFPHTFHVESIARLVKNGQN